jgi:rod shape-determining protein MreD
VRLGFGGLLALAFVLEPTLAALIPWVQGRPLLVLGLLVYYALVRGAPAGTLFGLFLGFLSDLMALHGLGLFMLTHAVVGFAVGNTWTSVYKGSAWVQGVILFLAVMLHESITYMVLTRLDIGSFPAFLVRFAAPTSLVTAAALPLVLLAGESLLRKELRFDTRPVVVRRRRR